jgi:hypothetical protein
MDEHGSGVGQSSVESDRNVLARLFDHLLERVLDVETGEDAWEAWEFMEKLGLAKYVPFDPEAHASVAGADACEPGDPILVLTNLGIRLANLGARLNEHG